MTLQKIHFVLLLLLPSLLTFAQKKVSIFELDLINGQFIQRYTVGPFSGIATEEHANGKKKLTLEIKEGKPHGMFREWAPNGKKVYEVKYANGLKTGLETQWYATGVKKSEMNFVNGQADGLFSEWYKNKRRKSEGQFRYGKEEGQHQWWYATGQRQQAATYQNGLEEGKVQNWYESGQLRLESHYTGGKKNGLSTEWYGSGIKKSEVLFQDDLENGESRFWSKKGILVGIQDFAAGRLTKDINYRSGAINTGGAYKQVFNEKQSFFTVDITGETVIPRNSVDITYSVDGQLLQLFNYSLDNYLDGTTEPKNERETLELFVEKEQAYINRMTDFEIKVEKEWGQTASGSQYLHWHFVSPSSVAKDQKPRTVQREHYITIVCNRQILNLYSVVTNSDDPAAIPEMLKRIAESTQIKSDRIDLNKLIKKI